MKKIAAAALILGTLSGGSAWAHEAGEFFIRAGSATVRPTEGSDNVLGSLGGFNVSNNTQLGLTFTYMATDNIGIDCWRQRRSATRSVPGRRAPSLPYTSYRRR